MKIITLSEYNNAFLTNMVLFVHEVNLWLPVWANYLIFLVGGGDASVLLFPDKNNPSKQNEVLVSCWAICRLMWPLIWKWKVFFFLQRNKTKIIITWKLMKWIFLLFELLPSLRAIIQRRYYGTAILSFPNWNFNVTKPRLEGIIVWFLFV